MMRNAGLSPRAPRRRVPPSAAVLVVAIVALCAVAGVRGDLLLLLIAVPVAVAASFAGVRAVRTVDRLRHAAADAEEKARHFELARDLLGTISQAGYLTGFNGSWTETLGWTEEELGARPFIEFVHPDDRPRTAREASRLLAGESSIPFTTRFAARDGGWRYIEWAWQSDGKGTVYAAARDVTERVHADAARREAEARFRRAFEDSATGMGLVRVSADGPRLIEVNEALARMLGAPRDELRGPTDLVDFAHPDDADSLALGLRRLDGGELSVLRAEVRIMRHDGRTMWVDMTTSLLSPADGGPLYRLTQLQDVDARKRAEGRLRYFAEYDALTGVFNRRRFEAELDADLALAAAGDAHSALLMLDIDGFKAINDTLGHAAGDEAITRIGRALVGRVRNDDVVGRLGGDEFAVLLRNVTAPDARAAAEGVRHAGADALASLCPHDMPAPTLSIGLVILDGEAQDARAMLRYADEAMYRAKAAGGDQVVFGDDSQVAAA